MSTFTFGFVVGCIVTNVLWLTRTLLKNLVKSKLQQAGEKLNPPTPKQ